MLSKQDPTTSRPASAKGIVTPKVGFVLIVDDDEDGRQAVSSLLESAGYRTAQAKDGRDALVFMQEAKDKPSLVLMDLMMPTMDGWQLRSRLRSDPDLAAIPIVIMTAHAGVLRAVSNASPDTPVLPKPIEADLLLRTVAIYFRPLTPRPV